LRDEAGGIRPFRRPFRIPEGIPLGTADPPTAVCGRTGRWRFPLKLARRVEAGAPLRLHLFGGRNNKAGWRLPQPAEPLDWISARISAGAELALERVEKSEGEFLVTVPPGGLDAGETVDVTLGREGPASGVVTQNLALDNKHVTLFLPVPTGPEVPNANCEAGRDVVAACLVHFVGGPAAGIRVYAPSQAAESVDLLVRPEDAAGNVASDGPGPLVVSSEGEPVDYTSEPVEGSSCVRVRAPAPKGQGVARFVVASRDGTFSASSNPVEPGVGPSERFYWGMIHGHTETSDGAGSLDHYFSYMRDECRLDFGATGDHDHVQETSDDMWTATREAVARHNDPGRFVAILGYEWAKWRRNGDGDRNVYYLADDRPMYRSNDGHYPSPPDLFKALADETAIVIPHHTAMCGNFCDFKDHDPVRERLIEIYSIWGNSERSFRDGNPYPPRPPRSSPHAASPDPAAGEMPCGFVQRALELGWRVGFTAGGDDHTGHAGDDVRAGYNHWVYPAGLFGVWAGELTRRAVWDALWNRRTVATTGARIICRLTLDGRPMGSELAAAEHSGPRRIRVEARGTAPIERIEMVRNNLDVHATRPAAPDAELEWLDPAPLADVNLPPAPFAAEPFTFYYARITQTDGQMAWTSPVWIS
jgi:hypothetical protein